MGMVAEVTALLGEGELITCRRAGHSEQRGRSKDPSAQSCPDISYLCHKESETNRNSHDANRENIMKCVPTEGGRSNIDGGPGRGLGLRRA